MCKQDLKVSILSQLSLKYSVFSQSKLNNQDLTVLLYFFSSFHCSDSNIAGFEINMLVG